MDRDTQWWAAATVTGVMAVMTAMAVTADLSAQARQAATVAAPNKAAAGKVVSGSAASKKTPPADVVERGRYLVNAVGCGDATRPGR